MPSWKSHKHLICLWLLALFTWWLRYHPFGAEGLVFDEDARQHVYWTARFQDPTLFSDDLLTDFVSSAKIAPWGYQLTYRLGTRLMAPLPFSQLLSLFLLLMSLWCLDRVLAHHTTEPTGRFVAGLFFLLYHTHNTVHNVSGGFARSFALPLLLLFLLLLQRAHFRRALTVLLLELLFYPPLLPNTVALAAADVLQRWWHGLARRQVVAEGVALLGMTLVVGMVLLSISGHEASDISGPQVTLAQARHMPEFYPGGRSVFFQDNLFAYFLTGRSGIGILHLSGFLLVLCGMGLILGWRHLRIPPRVWHLVCTSLVLFGLAHLVLFRLYLPSRYTFYTLSLAAILVIGMHVSPCLRVLQGRWPEKVQGVARLAQRYGLVCVVVLLIAYALAQSYLLSWLDPRLVRLEPQDMDMLEFLASLPPDAVVAGHPLDMDNVPLVAQRKVLANSELSLPYYLGFYTRIKQRLLDTFRAYYATQWQDVRSFVQHYAITALVVRKERFQTLLPHGNIYYEPFQTLVHTAIGDKPCCALAKPPAVWCCFANDRYIVLCFTPWQHEASGDATGHCG